MKIPYILKQLPRRSSVVRLFAVLAFFTGCGCLAWWQQPTACYHRALAALDSWEPEVTRLERVRYGLLEFGDSPACEHYSNLLKAKLLLAENRTTAALDSLSIAEMVPETRVRAYVLAGEALNRTGQVVEAIGAWDKAIQLDPECIDAHRWLGATFYELGAFFQAFYYMDEVARLDPYDPRPLRVKGLMWSYLDTYPLAVEAYREALRRNPEYSQADEIRFELAKALNELHEDHDALAVLEKMTPDADVLTMRASCHYDLGESSQAKEIIEQAIDLEPNQFKALCLRARLALDEVNPKEALSFALRAARSGHENAEVLNLLIASYLRLGQHDEAKRLEAKLHRVTRLLDEYHNLISEAAQDPTNSSLRYRVGMVAADLDLKQDAKRWLRAALSLEPENPEFLAALQRLESPWQDSYSPN